MIPFESLDKLPEQDCILYCREKNSLSEFYKKMYVTYNTKTQEHKVLDVEGYEYCWEDYLQPMAYEYIQSAKMPSYKYKSGIVDDLNKISDCNLAFELSEDEDSIVVLHSTNKGQTKKVVDFGIINSCVDIPQLLENIQKIL